MCSPETMKQRLEVAIQLNAISKELNYLYKNINILVQNAFGDPTLSQDTYEVCNKLLTIMIDAGTERTFAEISLKEKYMNEFQQSDN